ncbi:phosphocarrier protein HPr /dihydroxyacetone kinase DhaM subunit [Isoptericola jiangsuensis]|uniref:Phosphocarrier protein HPr n=1 Tax=Isoptericola jiangsuensis TaxID=548579 RepID=A0A2A9EWX5_9MICO|nr:dihydroxyacetone kinase phosphoryl donor subunit DhaM [Isoptericola jiangsuensis]PFG42735.1 phosphocarrier protein HPr /dihydroxyacetone kinase DhaM subunit [Isoptericola jiangsuensis]
MTVGLVLVSHSVRLAEGTAELAAQMAPDVVVRCAAGGPDGGLGTSFDKVVGVLAEVLAEVDGAVVLADLGSAVLTVESAFELDPDLPRRARLVSAPFVEGAVAAAVTAQQGAGLEAVAGSAQDAVRSIGAGPVLELVEATASDSPAAVATTVPGEVVGRPAAPSSADDVTAAVRIRNPLGLHARPAAVVARATAELGVTVTIDGADASSVLQLMSLGTSEGQVVTVAARGPGAEGAVALVRGLIEGGFGEV